MSFNLQQAIRGAETIEAMYRGKLKANVENTSTDTQARVDLVYADPGLPWSDGTAVVVFPGTASLRDWRTDAKILKTDWLNGKAHRGFVGAWRSVASDVLNKVHGSKQVVIFGHSLGGALATLCADFLKTARCNIEAVYTFGSPRVGNGKFARSYNSNLGKVTYRIVNARDPVPWLPVPLPSPRSGFYTHTEQLLYLLHDGGLGVGSQLLHPADLIAAVSEQVQEQKFFRDVLTATCHQMTEYIPKLRYLEGGYA